jgi:MoaA/NifB/PqqE/SkfB family radical SAM enzyme
MIKTIHVEASTYCNARCPLCPRNLYGYNVSGVYKQEHLSIDNFNRCLTQFPERTFVYFNGNLGDPMMNPDIVSLTKLTNCRTAITTNGSIGTKQSWIALAQQGVEVTFSIDGLEDTNHLYRQDVEWSKVIERIEWFISNGGSATWKWVVFKHNSHQLDLAQKLSKQLGFKKFEINNHGRNYGPVLNKNAEITHWILPHDKDLKPMPYDVKAGIERYKTNHNNFQPLDDILDIDCEHERDGSVYISAQGLVSPCCYQGFNLPQRDRVDLSQFTQLKKTWNTKQCDRVCADSCGRLK